MAGVLVGGLALAIVAHLYLSSESERSVKQKVLSESQDRAELLRSSGQRSLEVLHAMASFFRVLETPTRSDFEAFVQSSLKRLPQLQALEWIPRVPHNQREGWELRAREDGITGFSFTEIAADGSVKSAGIRDEYFPVYYAEPKASNLPALGLDLASNATRRAALLHAAASSAPVSTQTIRLAQEKRADRFGFLVFMPLYSEAPTHHQLSGFALAVFRVDDFFAPAFASMEQEDLSVRVLDPDDSRRLLLSAGAPLNDSLAQRLSHSEVVELAGRRWELVFTPSERLVARFRNADAYGYPLLLLLLTALLCTHIYRGQQRTFDVERKVVERTTELTQEIESRQRTEMALLEAQQTLERSKDELERRVVQRTSELALANSVLQAEISIRKRAQQEAATAHSAQSNFLASMSHEIRTPLNAIVGYSQILHRQLQEPRHFEAVTVMLQSSNHLLTLVDDILDLSKIESGHVRLHLVDFNLGALLASVMFMFRNKCERRGLALTFEGIGVAPCWVRGDEGKLRQVLLNLMSNAVKFTEQGEVRLRVHATGDDEFEFRVVDTGTGIDTDEQQRVFEHFFQSKTSKQVGTGLGLAISHRLVDAMGGKLEFESRPGKGSAFGFRLHLGPPLAVVRSEVKAQFPRMRLAATASCRAMVVDDLKVNRDLLCEMLEAVGCETLSVASGERAIETAPEFQPDIVFMDVLMPEMDGFETTRGLLQRLGREKVKVVAFSASALAEQRAKYLEAGFDDFLPKPFRTERVNEMLSSLLGLRFVAFDAGSEASRVGPVSLPPAMRQRLAEAARLYQATRLRALLVELEMLGAPEAALAARLRTHATVYDMRGLVEELDHACHAPGCAPS